MRNYPKLLTLNEWIEKFVFTLPKNFILKLLYLPIFTIRYLLLLVSKGFNVLFDSLPIYPIYLFLIKYAIGFLMQFWLLFILLVILTFFILITPFYITYFIYYYYKKERISRKIIHLFFDKEDKISIDLKSIHLAFLPPVKEGFVFLNWEFENHNKVTDFWKLRSGTKLFAKWVAAEPVKPLVEKKPKLKIFYLRLEGVRRINHQTNINTINPNDELIFVKQTDKYYDLLSKVLVKTKNNLNLGYVPKVNKELIKELIDKGIKIKVYVEKITGLTSKYKGVTIKVAQEVEELNKKVNNNRSSLSRTSSDYDLYDSFGNDNITALDSSFVDRDNDGGNEPERDIDFDSFDSDY